MSIMTPDIAAGFAAPRDALIEAAAARLRRVPRGAWALVVFGVVYVGGGTLRDALLPPEAALRGRLAAAVEMHARSRPPRHATLDAVGQHFSRHDMSWRIMP